MSILIGLYDRSSHTLLFSLETLNSSKIIYTGKLICFIHTGGNLFVTMSCQTLNIHASLKKYLKFQTVICHIVKD